MSAGPHVELRRYTPADQAILATAVDLARAAQEFRGSSDKDGSFFFRLMQIAPSPVVMAVDPDGSVAGFVAPEVKLTWVRPEHRRHGIGRQLVHAAVGVERERGRSNVLMGLDPLDGGGRAFLGATGFTYHSTLWDLALPADAIVAAPTWPAGVVARTLDWDRDKWAWQALFNAAFADHATPMAMPDEVLDAPPDPAMSDDDTVVLADERGTLVGFCSTQPEREHGRVGSRGEIWTVGVLPEHQGRGLGRQLLRWGVARLRSIGVRDVVLSVNGRNARALGLYESEGFLRTITRERWARAVDPFPASPA